jgi:hypothetical protein
MPKRRVDPVAAHAELLGRVTIAWNRLQYIFFLIFTALSGMPVGKAQAVYFTLKADTAQRDITAKVAAVALKSRPVLLERFTKIMKAVNDLAGQRNAATHTIWDIEETSGMVEPTPGAKHHGSLEEDFADQFRRLEASLGRHYSDLVELQREFPQPRASRGKDR